MTHIPFVLLTLANFPWSFPDMTAEISSTWHGMPEFWLTQLYQWQSHKLHQHGLSRSPQVIRTNLMSIICIIHSTPLDTGTFQNMLSIYVECKFSFFKVYIHEWDAFSNRLQFWTFSSVPCAHMLRQGGLCNVSVYVKCCCNFCFESSV